MTPTGRTRVGRSYFLPAAPLNGALMQLPPSLAIALWFTGSVWVVGILACVFEQPSEVVGGVFIMGLVAALMEWLTSQKPK